MQLARYDGWCTVKAPKTPRFVRCGMIAQSVEQRPFKAWVLGSRPRRLTQSRVFNI